MSPATAVPRADGEIVAEERTFIDQIAEAWNIDPGTAGA